MLSHERSLNQIMEKVHKRNKCGKLFAKGEIVPKMYGFREGIKNLNAEEIEEINRDIIKNPAQTKYIGMVR